MDERLIQINEAVEFLKDKFSGQKPFAGISEMELFGKKLVFIS